MTSLEVPSDNQKIFATNYIGLLNSDSLTCQESQDTNNKCMKCNCCRIIVLTQICQSLLSHLTHQDVIYFIENCILREDFNEMLNNFLVPLLSKDRIYTQCRATPGLETDVYDIGLKNFIIDKSNLKKTIYQIGVWMKTQPHEFRSRFLCSILSSVKLTVLAELYKRSMMSIEPESHVLIKRSDNSKFVENSTNFIDELMDNAKLNRIERTSSLSIDFISNLPIHIGKHILNLLDEKSLKICSNVSPTWKKIVGQVRKEDIVNQKIKEQAMLLQAVSSIPADPDYANDIDVRIPKTRKYSNEVLYIDDIKKPVTKKSPIHNLTSSESESDVLATRNTYNMETAYRLIQTHNVIVEERNVFCGAYSVFMVVNGHPREKSITRTICYNGGSLVAMGLGKSIQFADIDGKLNQDTKTRIHGHSGSIFVLRFINNIDNINDVSKESQMLSGSFDTTIRRWDVHSGKCLMIYIGHMSSVTCIDVSDGLFASGSQDGTCRIWRYKERKSIFKLRHLNAVNAVALSNHLCVSGDSSGLVKVWNLTDGTLIKNLNGHSRDIRAIKVDNFHILTASKDCFVYMWSAVGDFPERISSFRHPKPVMGLEFMFMRAITSSEDGRIRIWNITNGQCIRLLRGNSKSDPILNMVIFGDRILVNTISNILVLNFEPINWKYNGSQVQIDSGKLQEHKTEVEIQKNQQKSPNIHYQRHQRARIAGNIDPRIFFSSTYDNIENTTQLPNEMFITRSNTWLVSPSLGKSYLIPKKSKKLIAESTTTKMNEKNNNSGTVKKTPSRVSSGRRISYGFENPERSTYGLHEIENLGNINEIKSTLRRHIRSQPNEAADAMPDYVKAMVTHIHLSADKGRPVSSTDYQSKRRYSGPDQLNTKYTVPVDDIRSQLSPSTATTTANNRHYKKSSTKIIRSKSADIPENYQYKSLSFSTSFKPNSLDNEVSVKVPLAKVTLPTDFREKLTQKRKELEKQRLENNKLIIIQSEEVEPVKRFSTKVKVKPKIINLGLQTCEEANQQLITIETNKNEYDNSQRFKLENEKHLRWVEKATLPSSIKYNKDVLMKRPRSAKI